MNRLPRDKQIQVLASLVEGNSIRATVRMTGVAKNTVSKLLLEVGQACERYHDTHVRNLQTKRVECDEIWAFVYAKDKNVPSSMKDQPGVGSVWTWVGLDADSKLAVSWLVGERTAEYANYFMQDIASRLSNRVQLTTDGHRPYIKAVEGAFGNDIDYALLIKQYGTPAGHIGHSRYSPDEVTSVEKVTVKGSPDKGKISTSYVERQNLTMRMSMRRFTRLTNAFSKKVENLEAAVALHFMHYNFVRIHQTLRCTPAMEAGVTKRLWNLGDIVDLLNEQN